MKHFFKGAVWAALTLMLVACAGKQPLEAELQGKTIAERQQILLRTCHKTAQEGANAQTSGHYHRNARTMSTICNLMAQEFHSASSAL